MNWNHESQNTINNKSACSSSAREPAHLERNEKRNEGDVDVVREIVPALWDPVEGDEAGCVGVRGDDHGYEEDMAGGNPGDEEEAKHDITSHLETEITEQFCSLDISRRKM